MKAKLDQITKHNLAENVTVVSMVHVLINGTYCSILVIYIFPFFFPLFSGLKYSGE